MQGRFTALPPRATSFSTIAPKPCQAATNSAVTPGSSSSETIAWCAVEGTAPTSGPKRMASAQEQRNRLLTSIVGASRRASTHNASPWRVATKRGVALVLRSGRLTSAPAFTRVLTTAECPRKAATKTGVASDEPLSGSRGHDAPGRSATRQSTTAWRPVLRCQKKPCDGIARHAIFPLPVGIKARFSQKAADSLQITPAAGRKKRILVVTRRQRQVYRPF